MEPSILVTCVKDKLDEIQSSLLDQPLSSFRDSNILNVTSYNELKEAISQGKWARGPWSASDADELRVKEETGATIRCFPFDQSEGIKTCLMTGDPAKEVAFLPSHTKAFQVLREMYEQIDSLVQSNTEKQREMRYI